MALDIDDAKEMVSRIIQEVDYDIWKEMIDDKNNPDGWDINYSVDIVGEYVKVNP